MQLIENHKRTVGEMEPEMEIRDSKRLRRSVTFDEGLADRSPTKKSPSTPWGYADANSDEEEVEFDADSIFAGEEADLADFADFEDMMPPRVSPEQFADSNGHCHEYPTGLPTLIYTDCNRTPGASPEHPHTLFSPEPATEVAATEHPTAWDSQDVETAADAETRLSQEADFAYLASTLAAWSPASPLPEDPKTFQQQDPKTLQEADDTVAPDTVLLEGCDELA